MTVVIPTLKERDNIAEMAAALRSMYPDFYIVFMDDCSKDGSAETIRGLGDPKTKFVERDPDDRGLSASIFQGIEECGTDYFAVMDCDFQHPVEIIGRMYGQLENGSDLCIGTRTDRFALGFVRWAGSWAFSIFANLYLFCIGRRTSKDPMSGLFAGKCGVYAPVIREHSGSMERKGWKALLDLLKFGPRDVVITHEGYKFRKRERGKSNISPRVVYYTFRQCGILGRGFARVYAFVKGIKDVRCRRGFRIASG
ncbi:MAG: glycosyltransferase [Candidatus Methanomethylophilaceae archaeon]|nr:glycosyltransferase [Candidatus Methanomethylophilaceae archaeon]